MDQTVLQSALKKFFFVGWNFSNTRSDLKVNTSVASHKTPKVFTAEISSQFKFTSETLHSYGMFSSTLNELESHL